MMGRSRAAIAADPAASTRWEATPPGPGGVDGHRLRVAYRHPMGTAAARDGLRLGGMTCWRRLARLARGGRVRGFALGAAPATGGCGQVRLEPCLFGLMFHPRAKGGEKTGANPVDRGRPGTKRHLVVERGGMPLAAVLSGRQRARLPDAGGGHRRCSTRRGPPWQATPPAQEAPCGQGLRLRSLPGSLASTRYHSTHRPSWTGQQPAPGPPPLGR